MKKKWSKPELYRIDIKNTAEDEVAVTVDLENHSSKEERTTKPSTIEEE